MVPLFAVEDDVRAYPAVIRAQLPDDLDRIGQTVPVNVRADDFQIRAVAPGKTRTSHADFDDEFSGVHDTTLL
jgi:hypothetical protein